MNTTRIVLHLVGLVASAVVLTQSCQTAAQNQPKSLFVETKGTNGLVIGVMADSGLDTGTPDSRLCFSVWTTNWASNDAPYAVIFPVEPESAYRVDLLDTNGASVQRTELGNKVGSKFSDFNTNSFFIASTGHWTGPGVKSRRIIPSSKTSPHVMSLFRPADLFEIKKPGDYSLRIWFQVIALYHTGPGRGQYTNALVHFQPIDYPIIKK